MSDELEKRKRKIFNFFKKESENDELEKRKSYFGKKNLIISGILAVILWIGYYIRTRNLPLLKDITTGKYVPLALDPHAFLRYARYILEHRSLMSIDYMR